MELGGLAWMNAERDTMENLKRQKRLHLNLRKLLLRNLLSTTNFAKHFVLKLAFLLRRLIESGRMPRETSRSESRVEKYLDFSNLLLPFITPDSNDLTSTHNTLFNNQNPHQVHGRRSLHSRIHRARIARRTDLLAFVPLLPSNHCNVILLSNNSQWFHGNTNLFLDTLLASRWSFYS